MRAILLFMLIFSLSFLEANSSSEFSDFDDEFKTDKVEASWDPIEFYNVPMTKFNDFFYMYILGPVAKGYKTVINKPIREGVSNIFDNIQFPIRFANNLLQLKFNNAFEESARFVINSTYGLAGFIDLAKSDGNLQPHNEDFGQTLGFYGVGNDIHIVLPFLGPSNLRDTVGIVVDGFAQPLNYAHKQEWGMLKDNENYLYINAYKTINEYSLHVDEYENIRKDAVDLYILLKNIYDQRRNKLIEE